MQNCFAMFILAAAAVLSAVPTVSRAQDNPVVGISADQLLSKQRWTELSYGVSIRPPIGATLQEYTDDGSLLVMTSQDGAYSIRFTVKRSNISLASFGPPPENRKIPAIENVMQFAQNEMVFGTASEVRKTQYRRIADRAGGFVYYLIRDKKKGDMAAGQAFVIIDKKTFAMIEMRAPVANSRVARTVFETMARDIKVAAAEKIRDRRQQWSERALQWHATFTTEAMHKAIIPEQLYRVVDRDQTIGWVRVVESKMNGWEQAPLRKANEQARNQQGKHKRKPVDLNVPGVGVHIQGRIHVQSIGSVIDIDARYFVSDDRAQELWTQRISLRGSSVIARNTPLKKPGTVTTTNSVHSSWAETGIRDGEVITVSLETPGGVKYYEWPRPPVKFMDKIGERREKGQIIDIYEERAGFLYLTQVEKWLLPRLLAKTTTEPMGYYTYRGPGIFNLPGVHFHANQVPAALSYHLTTRRLDPLSRQFVVSTRPTLHSAAEQSLFDSAGKLTSMLLAKGLKVLPTTRDELSALKAKFQ